MKSIHLSFKQKQDGYYYNIHSKQTTLSTVNNESYNTCMTDIPNWLNVYPPFVGAYVCNPDSPDRQFSFGV